MTCPSCHRVTDPDELQPCLDVEWSGGRRWVQPIEVCPDCAELYEPDRATRQAREVDALAQEEREARALFALQQLQAQLPPLR